MDDQQLINGLELGDPKAFEELFFKYYTPLVVFALRMVSDEDMARELVQDIFVSFYEKRGSLNIHTSLKSHLYQSVRNRCLNYIKRDKLVRGHHQIIFDQNKDNEAVSDRSMEEVELEQQLLLIINDLPDKCREVFELSRFDGKSNQEIADQMSISKRTVETQISKALKIVREKITKFSVITLFIGIALFKIMNELFF